MAAPAAALSLPLVRHPAVRARPQEPPRRAADQSGGLGFTEHEFVKLLQPACPLGLSDVHELVPEGERGLSRGKVGVEPDDPDPVTETD
jgi:hypothetical protein